MLSLADLVINTDAEWCSTTEISSIVFQAKLIEEVLNNPLDRLTHDQVQGILHSILLRVHHFFFLTISSPEARTEPLLRIELLDLFAVLGLGIFVTLLVLLIPLIFSLLLSTLARATLAFGKQLLLITLLSYDLSASFDDAMRFRDNLRGCRINHVCICCLGSIC